MKYLIITSLLITTLSLNAEVITDGTLGQQIDLPGPDFQITSDLGQQYGGNLFHSFQDFNLNSSESATFSGPNNVQNILSRVTGGNPSNIDGQIRSTIPNADFYFLNPYGIMFGPNAQLDIQGSFHTSTADYLRLGENGRFDANNPSNSLLTVAPVEAFGFLGSSAASISMEGSQLAVPTGKTFSLNGGDLTLNKTKLSAPSGQINLTSIKGQGEIIPTDITALSGDIKISNNSLLDISGEGSGNLFIRGGQFVINGSNIKANSLNKDGGKVSIQANNIHIDGGSRLIGQTRGAGNATKIKLQATESVKFSGKSKAGFSSRIDARAYGAGKAGSIIINADKINFENGSLIFLGSRGKGDATHIDLHANQIVLANGSAILAGSFGQGKAANINIYVKDSLKLGGKSSTVFSSRIYSSTRGNGNAGQIYIEAKDIFIDDGGQIITGSSGVGNAGNIHLRVNGTITMTGYGNGGQTSAISANTFTSIKGNKGGSAGKILIEADRLIVTKGGIITATTTAAKDNSSGAGGHITIKVKDQVELNGVNLNGENEDGFGSGIYAGSNGVGNNAGDGGHIDLQAGSLIIKDGAVIKNSTNNNADGGNITIVVDDIITIAGDSSQAILQEPKGSQVEYLKDFSPAHYNESTSGIFASSTSDSEQAGNSGAISLNSNRLVLQENGTISTSSAGGGKAGNITLQVGQLKLDNSAKIISESQMANSYSFNQLAERDSRITIRGDIIEVADIGTGKIGSYFNTGTELIRTQSINTVIDMEDLYNLNQRYSIEEGDVITVQNNGNRFVYAFNSFYGLGEWVQVGDKIDITLDNMNEIGAINGKWFAANKIPYPSATMIQVKDAGNGKPATFIYSSNLQNPVNEDFFGRAVRLKHFSMDDVAELQTLQKQVNVKRGDIATITDKFIYDGNQWIALNDTQKVANIAEMDELILIKRGDFAQVADTTFIYSEPDWITLNKRYEVADLIQRDQLSVQEGDLVKVLNTGGKPESFFYQNQTWHKRIHGGEAGAIQIIAQDIIVSDGSSIATEAVSSGGGSIKINTDNFVFLNNGKITASVQEGAGDGGSLSISKPYFVVLSNGQITAQAIEGNGGNIALTSKQFITSPNSLVSASSKLGLDGEVNIESLNVDMEGFLVVLPDETVEASSLMKQPCSMRGSSFTVQKIAGSPQTPYDYNPSTYLPEIDNKVKTVSKKTGEKLAFSTCKK
ncbi:filamentous hemagglutinin N-terminal domain-containing protein [Candidatus Halobeggiatoa sp. HSG11]|nr:filamentous hemagglutinin N-terminal domain-containing protein [Candidatus Halobeggiatoa sp. HSG11]